MAFIFEETASGTGERWVKSDAASNGATIVLLNSDIVATCCSTFGKNNP